VRRERTERLLDNLDAVGWRLNGHDQDHLTTASAVVVGYPRVLYRWTAQLGMQIAVPVGANLRFQTRLAAVTVRS
jgi:hypothetical protein